MSSRFLHVGVMNPLRSIGVDNFDVPAVVYELNRELNSIGLEGTSFNVSIYFMNIHICFRLGGITNSATGWLRKTPSSFCLRTVTRWE